LQLVC
jgi:Na+/melibiose symporter and related transporters